MCPLSPLRLGVCVFHFWVDSGPSRAFRMSQVRTFFLLLSRDSCWRFSGRYENRAFRQSSLVGMKVLHVFRFPNKLQPC